MEGSWSQSNNADNDYLFNGIERNEEFGLNWDMAEYRAYDAAIGRWNQVDPLAAYKPDITPYRFGFNNPILYIDPAGLFESKRKAKQYAKDNGIKTGLFRRNKVIKQNDGSYAIENKKIGSSTFDDAELGVVTGGLAVAPSKTVNTAGGMFIGGEKREPVQGIMGNLGFLYSGGIENGIRYNRNGYPIARAPIMGEPLFGSPRVPKGEFWYNLVTKKGQKGGTFISKTGKYFRFLKEKIKSPKLSTSKGNPTKFINQSDDEMRKFHENGAKLMKKVMEDFN